MSHSKPEKKAKSETLCKNCGADLVFAPGTSALKCKYCGAENVIEIKQEEIEEIDFLDFLNKNTKQEPKQEIVTVRCDGCGAETTFDENLVSQECAFCATPLVLKNETTSNIVRPKSLLPFHVDEKDAISYYQKWLKSLWFAPNKLKKYARQKGKVTGIYIPYWTYDSDTYSDYYGQRGDDYHYTETYTNSDGQTATRTITRTRWTRVSGNVRRFFDDVLVLGSHSLPVEYADKLEPWDLKNLVPFDEKYLSGFKAEKYQVDVENAFRIAKEKMRNLVRTDIRRDIGGDHQRIESIKMQNDDITFKHILLPLWISSYKYNQKVYRFLVNARTGEVQGERPYSVWKITFAILLALVFIAIIIYYTETQ